MASSYNYFSTKVIIKVNSPIATPDSSYRQVEVILKKYDTRSWTLLEKTTRDLGNVALTFGVGGRTGTVGAKTPIVDQSNKAK